jgi:hypothetical protein
MEQRPRCRLPAQLIAAPEPLPPSDSSGRRPAPQPSRGVRESGGEIWPELSLVAAREQEPPEPEPEFTDDLSLARGLLFRADTPRGLGDVLAPTLIQHGGGIGQPSGRTPKSPLPQVHPLCERAAQHHFDVTDGFPERAGQLRVPPVQLDGGA